MSFSPRMLRFTQTALLTASVCWVSEVLAADAIRAPGHRPQPASAHALVGGRVVVKPGGELEKGTTFCVADGSVRWGRMWRCQWTRGCTTWRARRFMQGSSTRM